MLGQKIAVWKPDRKKFVFQRETHALRQLIGHENYGLNVFEGCRIYQLVDGTRAIFRWEDHKQRLIQSAEAYGMPVREWPFTPEQLWDVSQRLLAFNEGDSYLRPCVYIKGDLKVADPSYSISAWVATRDWDPDRSPYLPATGGRGLRLLVTDLRRAPPQPQTWAKGAGNYQLSWVAKKRAIARGLDDALVLDTTGQFISEGSGYSILFYYKNANLIVMPDDESSALDSITSRTVAVLAEKLGISFIRTKVPKVMGLLTPDEIFVAGTAIEIAGVRYLEDETTGLSRTQADASGPLTRELQKLYRHVVTGKEVVDESWYARVPTWFQATVIK